MATKRPPLTRAGEVQTTRPPTCEAIVTSALGRTVPPPRTLIAPWVTRAGTVLTVGTTRGGSTSAGSARMPNSSAKPNTPTPMTIAPCTSRFVNAGGATGAPVSPASCGVCGVCRDPSSIVPPYLRSGSDAAPPGSSFVSMSSTSSATHAPPRARCTASRASPMPRSASTRVVSAPFRLTRASRYST